MSIITIPADVGQLQGNLTALDGLLRAKKWERAAIVRAFVQLHPDESGMTAAEFAKLNIAGLRVPITVKTYAQAWELTGLPRPIPSDTVDLDRIPADLEYPANQMLATPQDIAVAEAFGDPTITAEMIRKIRVNRRGFEAAFWSDQETEQTARDALEAVVRRRWQEEREAKRNDPSDGVITEPRRPVSTPEQLAGVRVRIQLRAIRVAALHLEEMELSDDATDFIRQGVADELATIREMLVRVERRFGLVSTDGLVTA